LLQLFLLLIEFPPSGGLDRIGGGGLSASTTPVQNGSHHKQETDAQRNPSDRQFSRFFFATRCG
jgi:hypothetical protein